MFNLAHIDHVALTVADLERSRQWYQEVLGLEHLYPGEWDGVPLMLGVGGTALALFPASVAQPQPPVGSDTIAMRHLAFRADRANFEQAQAELRQRGIDFSFEDHTLSHSIYFSDPDGYRLEITTYDV